MTHILHSKYYSAIYIFSSPGDTVVGSACGLTTDIAYTLFGPGSKSLVNPVGGVISQNEGVVLSSKWHPRKISPFSMWLLREGAKLPILLIGQGWEGLVVELHSTYFFCVLTPQPHSSAMWKGRALCRVPWCRRRCWRNGSSEHDCWVWPNCLQDCRPIALR